MITIVLQAGGESSRMGRDKALLEISDKPLIAWVVERVSVVADKILVITNQPAEYEFLGLPLFTDIYPGRGALGGLFTALSIAKSPFIGVIACDMPFVEPALLHTQFSILSEEKPDVVIPCSSTGMEPMHAVYLRKNCLPAVEQALQQNKRRLISWYERVNVRKMPSEEVRMVVPDDWTFFNINTPEDFDIARQMSDRLTDMQDFRSNT